ncbi:hypothetical protein CDAR_607851 [Caerostris darwini]|uniref:Uncharacterized protein n=1 Tax=Caerostris darwini TaxID=1538125 RepID=A0AAV4ULF4_9ARAC|nr:hypothetical protein CDAR_607851 [Caerostris darwini]
MSIAVSAAHFEWAAHGSKSIFVRVCIYLVGDSKFFTSVTKQDKISDKLVEEVVSDKNVAGVALHCALQARSPATSKGSSLRSAWRSSPWQRTPPSLLLSYPIPKGSCFPHVRPPPPPHHPAFLPLVFMCRRLLCWGSTHPFGAFIAQLTWKKKSPSRCRFDSH